MALTTHEITINGALPDGSPMVGVWYFSVTAANGVVLDPQTVSSAVPGWRGGRLAVRVSGTTVTVRLPATGVGDPQGWLYRAEFRSPRHEVLIPAFQFSLTADINLASVMGGGVMPVEVGGVTWQTGTGNPNGSRSGGIGSIFTNTEGGGWNGARRWTKTTASGTSGWVVTDGDTGWRNITAWLTSANVKVNGDAAGGAFARRCGDQVELELGLEFKAANATRLQVLSIPSGWRRREAWSTTSLWAGLANSNAGFQTPVSLNSRNGSNTLFVQNAVSVGQILWADVTWTTTNDWPAP